MTRETPGLTTLLNVSLAIYLEGIEGKLTGGCFSAGQSNYGTAIAERPSRSLCRNQCVSPNMNSQEAWKRLANQLQKAGVSGGRGSIPGGKGAFAGGGLLIALVAGGIALNASLFNGTCARLSIPRMSHRTLDSRWWSPCYQIYSVRDSACDSLSPAYGRVIGCKELDKRFTPKELTSWYPSLWSSLARAILTRKSDSLA